MTTLYEDTNPRELRVLLEEIHNGNAVLPEFQRDFVWEPGAVAELICSVANGFPAGSILRIRNSRNHFASRGIEGAPAPQPHATFLVLDGQQRLTSLYQALFGTGPFRYFLDIKKLIEGANIDDENVVFYHRAERQHAKAFLAEGQGTDAREIAFQNQAKNLIFPLGYLEGSLHAFNTWKGRVLKYNLTENNGNEMLKLNDALDDIANRYIAPISAYRFPVVTLSAETSAEAICTIFETLNKTGIKLSPFELLTARFFPQGIYLRDLWSAAQEKYPIIEEFQLDPYTVLQAVTLLATNPATLKRRVLMDLKGPQISENWDRTVEALAQGLTFLGEECGIMTPKWLPYGSMLVPLAAVIAKNPIAAAGPVAGARREKLRCWFWRASLGQYYDSAANSKSQLDYEQLPKWFGGGVAPDSVSSFQFKTAELNQVTPRQRAIYRALMCLVMSNGARDFHSNQSMTAALMRANEVDDHHLFPLAFLKESDRRNPKAEFDNVLNRTLIDAKTNKSIGANSPAIYLAPIDEMQGRSQVDAILASHGIEGQTRDALRAAEYRSFLENRRAWFEARIAQATSLPGQPSVEAA